MKNSKEYRTVSILQWPLLSALAGMDYYRLEEAAKLDQRPLGSLYHRGWVDYRPGKGFHLTKVGLAAYDKFMGETRLRKHPEKPLSHYFDPIAYSLRPPAEKAKSANHKGAA
jgi:hypothetical protein